MLHVTGSLASRAFRIPTDLAPRLACLGLMALVVNDPVRAQGRTWIVDARGGLGVHFTEIAPAVVAAADGDRVEVRSPGPYADVTLDKALDLEAPGGATLASLLVTGIAAGRSARVAGFTLAEAFTPGRNGSKLAVRDCLGVVTLANVTTTFVGLVVDNSASVLVLDSAITGRRDVLEIGFYAEPGVSGRASSVALIRCSITGGDGSGPSIAGGPLPGRPGCDTDGPLLVAASTVAGGKGGPGGVLWWCRTSGHGGAGIQTTATCTVLDGSVLIGGLAGPSGGCGAGAAGPALSASALSPAAVTLDSTLAGSSANIRLIPRQPTMTTPRTVNLGQSMTTTVTAAPQSVTITFLAFDHAHAVLAGVDVPLLLPQSSLLPIAAGTLGGQGTFSFVLSVPLDRALANRFVFQQAAVSSGSAVQLSTLADVRLR